MYSPNNPYFNLSDEGEKEFGHIFGEGVPIKRGHLVEEAALEGSPNKSDRVCIVDWKKMTEAQKTKLVEKLSVEFESPASEVRAYFNDLGYVPMRTKFVIEAYDPRFFI